MQKGVEQDSSKGIDTALLTQFEGLKISTSPITNTQKSILESYFEEVATDYIERFIASAPLETQALRRSLVLLSTTLDAAIFKQVFETFYPKAEVSDKCFEQNKLFRNYFLTFNELCLGQTDINHVFYSNIFNPKLSTRQPDSPTKRHVISAFFRKQVRLMLESDLVASPFVDALNAFVKELKPQVASSSVRRALF